MADMKRKDVQRMAHELCDAITQMRSDMAVQDAKIQQQAATIAMLRVMGDRLAEQVLVLLGPLSTDADPATVEWHRIVRAGALAEWAEVRRG